MDEDKGMMPVYEGDRIPVRTFRGWGGNVIGRLPDGRVVLFSRDSPYLAMLAPGQEVDCRVVKVAPRYVIVDPIGEPTPVEKKSIEVDESLVDDLKGLAEGEDPAASVIARALLHIIERLDKH